MQSLHFDFVPSLSLAVLKYAIFAAYGACVALSIIGVCLFAVETMGVPRADMPSLFTAHWFWQRFYAKNKNEVV